VAAELAHGEDGARVTAQLHGWVQAEVGGARARQ
jgi:hypothetical protein